MFRRYEIIPVWDELKKKIKKEDIEWLKEHREAWKGYNPKDKLSWARNSTNTVIRLSLRIMEVLDAKKDRQDLPDTDVLLPKSYLLELAEILGVSHVYANEKSRDWEIENHILDALVRQTGYRPI